MLPKFIDKSKIPHQPGVYIFKGSSRKILYVGKAIDLYNRISSYFNGRPDSTKIASLVSQVADLETIVVESELEALVLEANLIKKHLPPYNIRLLDDKDYLYIKITKEQFPKVITARKNELKSSLDFFGPFPSSNTVRNTLKQLRRVFPWCSNPRGNRPCFYYHLGLCPGPCAGKINAQRYLLIINRFRKFLQGKKDDVVKELTAEMEKNSKALNFEQAMAVKKVIDGLKYLTQPNRTRLYLENPNFLQDQNKLSLQELKKELGLASIPERIECFDISNTSGKLAVGSLVVLSDGDIDKKWYRKFRIHKDGSPNDVAMMSEMVERRVRHDEWPAPDLVLVDGGKGQVRGVEKIILQKGWDIPVLGLSKRLEWLHTSGVRIIKLPKSSLSLRLLQKIRDEAHRVAVNYHRKLRNQAAISNRLYNKVTDETPAS